LTVADITPADVELFWHEVSIRPGSELDPDNALFKPERSVSFLYRIGEAMPRMSSNYTMRLRHLPVMRVAHGDVLLTGLGLGMVAVGLLKLPTVRSVTVIELDKHLIRMMRSQLPPALKIEHADAFHWQPRFNARYDVIWHDIWSDLGIQRVLPEHQEIMDLYAYFLKPGGWQECFMHDRMVEVLRQKPGGLFCPTPD